MHVCARVCQGFCHGPRQRRIFPSPCPVAMQSSLGWQATQVKAFLAAISPEVPSANLLGFEPWKDTMRTITLNGASVCHY